MFFIIYFLLTKLVLSYYKSLVINYKFLSFYISFLYYKAKDLSKNKIHYINFIT